MTLRAALLVLFLLPGLLVAQQRDSTLRRYDLTEVVIEEGEQAAPRVATVQRLGVAQLARLAPATAADLVRLVPAAHLQVNSRGEALVYLRGAPERQVALFLDGVPLNVPWDARFDLSLLPAFLLGSVDVTKGPFSVLYGPNTAGGVVDFYTKSLSAPGRLVEAEVSGGVPARGSAGVALHRHGRGGLLDVGVSVAARRGDAVPETADLLFSQGGTRLRTNTDRAQVGVLVRAATGPSAKTRLSATAFYADAEKGIAPEGHLDPATETVRYWRYPQLRQGTLTVAAERQTGVATVLRAQAWSSGYAQHIDQYESAGYDEVSATQRDGDATYGLRLSSRHHTHGLTVRTALLATTSLHRQRDGTPGETGELFRYRQHIAGAAFEASGRLAELLEWRLGAGLDAEATPLTGDKPGQDPGAAWSGAAGLVWRAAPALHVRTGASRKVRFPTMRELFGTALNRFLLNPNLKPEQVWSGELGAEWASGAYRADVAAFTQRTRDAIDQRTVQVDGKALRQRVNLEGSVVWGVEISGAAAVLPALRAEGHLTALRARGLEEGRRVPLAEKPALMVLLLLEARPTSRLRVTADLNRVAGAYAAERDGVRPRLPGAWLVGGRLSYTASVGRGAFTLYGRLDNVFGATLLPQEGLPAPGRTFVVGVSVQG